MNQSLSQEEYLNLHNFLQVAPLYLTKQQQLTKMNTFYTVCVLAFLGLAHGFSMTMNASERTYIMVRTKEFFFFGIVVETMADKFWFGSIAHFVSSSSCFCRSSPMVFSVESSVTLSADSRPRDTNCPP